MARGRSLLWLGIVLGTGAAVAWTGTHWWQAPTSVASTWPHLLGFAVASVALWGFFHAAVRLLRRHQSDAARSMSHLQTMAAALVALLAAGSLLGGFRTALVGLGLVGFGLTLALQRPILSLAGWASLAFGGNVKVGDRIHVGDITGDVLDITLFATRLWEVGGASSNTPGRPTGRVVTLSNAVFLEEPISNATSDTPVIFDEFVVNVSFESDLALARQLLEQAGKEVLQHDLHAKKAQAYRRLTRGLSMEADFPDKPTVLAESRPSWMELRLRYLVDARKAGRTQSKLTDKWTDLCAPHAEAIPQVYPRSQPQAIGPDGRARP